VAIKALHASNHDLKNFDSRQLNPTPRMKPVALAVNTLRKAGEARGCVVANGINTGALTVAIIFQRRLLMLL
jgi:hypothetical protein